MRFEPTSRVAAREHRVRAGLRLRRRQSRLGSTGLPFEGANGSETRAGTHLRADVPTCGLDDRLQTVCEQLEKSGWDTCFVVGRLGRRVIRAKENVSAEEAMTLGPSTIRPSARLADVVERMRRQSLTYLPVTTSEGRLMGLLMRGDAERALERLSS